MRDQKKERRIRMKFYTKYGHLIGCKTEDIPEEHRAPQGGLRCFKKIYPRDENGNKLIKEPRKRCKNVCSKGSLYCKKHGGGNSKALIHGQTTTMDRYKGSYTTELGGVLEAFIKDPQIMDHKNELGTLRLILTQYIDKFSRNKPIGNRKKLVRMITQAIEADHMEDEEKFFLIKEIVENETSLTDGQVVDRISRLVDNIGKSIERIDRIERKSDYFLTPEGFKIILRTIIELVGLHVKDAESQNAIRKGLMEASTKCASKDRVIDVKPEYN